MSVDEIATLLIAEVRRLKARPGRHRSLSGFEAGVGPDFRGTSASPCRAWCRRLASTGATVLMTSELEDRYATCASALRHGIPDRRHHRAALQSKVDSRLLRVMAVAKVRDSAHSNELRLFDIGDGDPDRADAGRL